MNCPKFVDFTRECIKEIEVLPGNTFNYCTTEKYVNCPFYKILSGDKNVCQNITKCQAFKNFQTLDFERFINMTTEWCVSENHRNCQRYILKSRGEIVPFNLHPDGITVKEWQ